MFRLCEENHLSPPGPSAGATTSGGANEAHNKCLEAIWYA